MCEGYGGVWGWDAGNEEGRGQAEARGRPSMGHADSDFKIIVTEREEEGKEEMGLERKP